MTGILTFALATLFIVGSSYAATSLLGLDDALERALATITIALAQVVALLLVAGVLVDRLDPNALLATSAVLFAGAVLVTTRGANVRFRVTASGSVASAWRGLRTRLWLAALLALVAVEVVWKLVAAYVLPPSGFDALWYHLTTVAWWLQEGRIAINPLTIWSSVYPANGELFFTWVAVFLRDDTFLDVVQLGFGLVGGVAVAGIARVAGLATAGAVASGAAFFLSPVVLAQASSAYVDLIFVSTFLLALYWVLRAFVGHGASPSSSRLVLAGLAAGIALGSKSTGIVYCGVLAVVVAAWLAFSVRKDRLRPLSSTLAFVCFALPASALGTYWYARAWATYGSPFYPVRVAAGGLELFGGEPLEKFLTSQEYSDVWWREIFWQWHQDRVPFAGVRYFGVGSSEGGLGPLWSYLMLPALVVFVFRAAKHNLPFLLSFFVPLAVIFALQPYRWWSRFTMELLAAGAIAFFSVTALLPQRVAGWTRWAAVVLVLAGVSYSTPTKSVLSRIAQPADDRSIGDVVAPWFDWVDDVPPGARIAVDVRAPFVGAPPDIWFFYPLFGRQFENHVVPLPTQGDAWTRAELAAREIDYVVIGAHGRFVRWANAEAAAGCFRRVFADDEHGAAYRRIPACG